MTKLTRTIGLLFTAAMSVYADQALFIESANAATPAASATPSASKTGNDIKLLDENNDPFSNTTAVASGDPTTKPSEGTSVTTSDVNVSDTGTVEIHVNDANLVEVLRMLSLQSQKNIIASNQVGGKVTANLYGVTVREALDAILHANGYAYREKGNFIYVYTVKEIADMEKTERQMSTEIFRLFYTPAANVVTMIKPVLSAEAQVSSTTPSATGLPTGTGDAGGDSHAIEDMIVITDYPDNLDKVRKLVAEIDRRPQQILIEATILRASLSEDNALGVDFQVLGGVDFSTITHHNGQATGADIPDSINPSDKTVKTAGTGNSFSSSVGNGLKVGIITNQLSVFLSALESVTDTTILANPKVLALNKQKGEVIVGRKDGYITTTVTENAQTQTVEFLDTGTRLVFRPYIGDDGYIRMEIHPEDSSGGLTGDNLPFKITTEVTSNVMVKDNHTIVIGGLFRESSDTARSQIPGLGNIPLFGAAFRQQRDRTTREEVIILLTPHIVKDDDVYSKSSEKELKEADHLRVGVRQGMMPWGRERLAETCYQSAVNEMNKEHPDKGKARFFLDCATNLNPTFREAIDMKQDLTGHEITMSDNSSIRTFVRRQFMTDTGTLPKLPHSVPLTPSTRPTAEMPTTQPAVVIAPATQPAAVAETPATEPAIASTETNVEAEEDVQPVAQTGDVDQDETHSAPPAPQSRPLPVASEPKKSGDENAPKSAVTDVTSEQQEAADDSKK